MFWGFSLGAGRSGGGWTELVRIDGWRLGRYMVALVGLQGFASLWNSFYCMERVGRDRFE